MSTFAIAESTFHPLMLSSRLISELSRARSTLRATTERDGLAVIVSAGGELDASNDATWRRLLSEASAAANALPRNSFNRSEIDCPADSATSIVEMPRFKLSETA